MENEPESFDDLENSALEGTTENNQAIVFACLAEANALNRIAAALEEIAMNGLGVTVSPR